MIFRRNALPSLGETERILVVKLSSLGDIVHATPVLRALRAATSAKITLAVDRAFVPLVANCPWLDDVVPAVEGRTRVERWREAGPQLGNRRFDLALDLQGSRRSARWMNAARAGARVGRAAPNAWRAWRLHWNRVLRPDPRIHAVRVCAAVAEAAGLDVIDLSPALHVSGADEAAAAALLAGAGLPERGFLVVNPFSRWASKAWPADRYAAVIRQVLDVTDARVAITGSREEREAGEALAAAVGNPRVVSLAGRMPLGEALCVFRRAQLMLTGDSGPMHAAAALGVPVVALFGPTLAECVGPWGEGHRVIQAMRPDRPDAFRSDPDGRFIRAIPIEAVTGAVISAWNSSGGEGAR